jgi:23S rRNA pseudouridine1911/1915/1917 synthase
MKRLDWVVAETAARLDRYLAGRLSDHSRTAIQRWIEEGLVLVNEQPTRASRRLVPGDRLTVFVPEPQPATVAAEPIPLVIVYEDNDLLVVDKPAGMVVHPAAGHAGGTLVNAVLHHCPDLAGVGGVQRPGIVHRLDKETSGLILVAKNDRAHAYLQAQFKARQVEKTYLALVSGHLHPPRGRIEAPIGRDPRHRRRMAVVSPGQGRAAITDYEVRDYYANTTLVAVYPRTGRTHQIRVHLAALGHPVVGDRVYGPARDPWRLGRHFLHAHRLRLRRPGDGAWLDLVSPLPAELEAVLARLEKAGGSPQPG